MNTFRRGDPSRLKIFRGVLMNLLYIATQGNSVNADDPSVVSREVLVTSLESLRALPGDEELRNAARYLEAKEYIKVEWLRDGSGVFNSVRLLAKGIDLCERTTEDAGVTFSRRQ